MTSLPHLLVLLLALTTTPLFASERMQSLLSSEQAPAGVVFEIVEGDENALEWAMPQVAEYVRQLRARFPGIGIAVVTHGSEQFALERRYRDEYATVHQLVRSLTEDENVPVHVCGTHASWYDVTPEDFPDYVDVSAAGPAQINDYRQLGWVLIKVEEPE
ncbi:MAG: hypothetical protein D6720_01840 [Gammaproteobacteria bacterium]|nr:MAG: hypothetical protein D6720_01840 [Gammaproteobacteria bacterium]